MVLPRAGALAGTSHEGGTACVSAALLALCRCRGSGMTRICMGCCADQRMHTAGTHTTEKSESYSLAIGRRLTQAHQEGHKAKERLQAHHAVDPRGAAACEATRQVETKHAEVTRWEAIPHESRQRLATFSRMLPPCGINDSAPQRLFEKSSLGGISAGHSGDERQSIPHRPHCCRMGSYPKCAPTPQAGGAPPRTRSARGGPCHV